MAQAGNGKGLNGRLNGHIERVASSLVLTVAARLAIALGVPLLIAVAVWFGGAIDAMRTKVIQLDPKIEEIYRRLDQLDRRAERIEDRLDYPEAPLRPRGRERTDK